MVFIKMTIRRLLWLTVLCRKIVLFCHKMFYFSQKYFYHVLLFFGCISLFQPKCPIWFPNEHICKKNVLKYFFFNKIFQF